MSSNAASSDRPPGEPRTYKPVTFATEVDRIFLKVELSPTGPGEAIDRIAWCRPGDYAGRQFTATGVSAVGLVRVAFGFSKGRCLDLVGLPDTRYSVEIILPEADELRVRALLQATLLSTFGIRVRHERRVMRVGVLSCVPGGALRFPLADGRRIAYTFDRGSIQGTGLTIGMVASILEESYACPFLDETGVTERYDMALAWAAEEMEGLSVTLAQGGVHLRWENREIELHLIEPYHPPAS